ncbi:MAG: RICIN domain-containing protein [Lachnospiraceae bacterium]|nr:RICIN domain-containing protein [Lachnospiraceae bacterium]
MGLHKKTLALAGAFLACASMLLAPCVPTQAATSSSTLIWSDEFNGSSLDTSKWTCEIGNGSGGWGNNELEYYTNRSENVSVRDGYLHITARNENYNGYNYTSARLKTQDKFYFTYGHIEARVALPSGSGIWPAFWMLGQNIGSVGWPACGETDIIEAINAENKVYGTCHWDSNGHAEYGNSSGNFDITQFHTYTCDWDSQYIRMYVDGNKYHEISIANSTGSTEEFHKPSFFLLNVAVGGNWPGFNVDNSRFPQEMKVDYIRVYQDQLNYTSTSGNSVDNNQGNNNSGNNGGNNSGNNGGNNNSGNSDSTTPASGMGMSYASANSASAYVNDSSWADIHYSVNGGGQQNVRMTQNGNKATYTINGLNNNDTVSYWFTYSNTSGYVQDTARYSYTHTAGSTNNGGSGSGSNNSGSSNNASGDIYIYQDINYGGRSASLGLGNYNLASLQAKGFRNDDLSSIKVPFGYKVTLYADDNFTGRTKVVTSDTNWIGNDFNDAVSSIKVEKARYRIFSRHSGLCLDVANASHDSGANIQQWYENGNDAQVFEVTMNSDSSFTITSVMHGKALDMGGWSKENGGNLIIWDNNNTDNQRWWITDLGDGYSSIINKYSGKGLDVDAWSTAGGANIQQWDYLGQANQQWKFVLVN